MLYQAILLKNCKMPLYMQIHKKILNTSSWTTVENWQQYEKKYLIPSQL